jgi:hypothetical protein
VTAGGEPRDHVVAVVRYHRQHQDQ